MCTHWRKMENCLGSISAYLMMLVVYNIIDTYMCWTVLEPRETFDLVGISLHKRDN